MEIEVQTKTDRYRIRSADLESYRGSIQDRVKKYLSNNVRQFDGYFTISIAGREQLEALQTLTLRFG